MNATNVSEVYPTVACHMCQEIGYQCGADLSAHFRQSHPGLKSFRCTVPFCMKTTGSVAAFLRHLKTSHNFPQQIPISLLIRPTDTIQLIKSETFANTDAAAAAVATTTTQCNLEAAFPVDTAQCGLDGISWVINQITDDERYSSKKLVTSWQLDTSPELDIDDLLNEKLYEEIKNKFTEYRDMITDSDHDVITRVVVEYMFTRYGYYPKKEHFQHWAKKIMSSKKYSQGATLETYYVGPDQFNHRIRGKLYGRAENVRQKVQRQLRGLSSSRSVRKPKYSQEQISSIAKNNHVKQLSNVTDQKGQIQLLKKTFDQRQHLIGQPVKIIADTFPSLFENDGFLLKCDFRMTFTGLAMENDIKCRHEQILNRLAKAYRDKSGEPYDVDDVCLQALLELADIPVTGKKIICQNPLDYLIEWLQGQDVESYVKSAMDTHDTAAYILIEGDVGQTGGQIFLVMAERYFRLSETITQAVLLLMMAYARFRMKVTNKYTHIFNFYMNQVFGINVALNMNLKKYLESIGFFKQE